jgi:hypothetical protein
MHVTWMNDDCQWYQRNERFMEFLADCAVMALMRGYYDFSPSFTEICQSYTDIVADYEKTDAFAEVVGPQEVIEDDSLGNITDSVRTDAHARRPSRHATNPAVDAPPAASTRANLAALNWMYLH